MKHITNILHRGQRVFAYAEKKHLVDTNFMGDFFEEFPMDTGIITIAGESGMGKSRLLKTLAYNFAIVQKIPSAYLSCRKHKDREADEFLAGTMGLRYDDIKNEENVDNLDELLESSYKKLADAPLYYESFHGRNLDLADLKAMLHVLFREQALRFVFIDGFEEISYLGAAEIDMRLREHIKAKELKRLSQELNITIIVTSGLNWSHYTKETGDHISLSDLAEIGDLQDFSNMVIGVFRPESYGIKLDKYGNYLTGTTEVSILKNAYGRLKRSIFCTAGPIFEYEYMFSSNL